MSFPEKPIANPIAVLREEFDNWAVLFNPDTADVIGISPVGVRIWKLMDGQRTVSDIAASLAEHFSGLPATAEEDVVSFILELSGRGFVGAETS
ncbi:MAG: PqqD family peptide modification chaperone [Desulfomonile sp.]|jgi:SynChlorMet cassette protein ScmD